MNDIDRSVESMDFAMRRRFIFEEVTAEESAENMNLSEEQVKLATLIGLLHDIARFEQMKRYGTYKDKISIDHGDFAIEILEKDNFIRKFIETDKYDNIIKIAIKNHNKYKIENLEGEELLQSKIIMVQL